jgi:hypothetical protein
MTNGFHDCLIQTKEEEITEKTGGWYYASRSLLEPYGFSRGNGRYQYLLLEWLKKHNRDKIDERTDYFILQDGNVTIETPANRCSVGRIIGNRLEGQVGTWTGVQHINNDCCILSEPQWMDKDGNAVNKWVMGKRLYLSVKCKSNQPGERIHFRIYNNSNDALIVMTDTVDVTDGIARVEWVYNYNKVREEKNEYQAPPKFYFVPVTDRGYKLQGGPLLEMSMEICITVVDANHIIMIDDYTSSKGIINLEFSTEQTIDKKKDKVFDVKTDKNGGCKQDGLIPCDVTVKVKTPIERKYTDETYPKDIDNPGPEDSIIDTLDQIDGHESITTARGNNKCLDAGKINVIKLPVRYLDSVNRTINIPNQMDKMTEVQFVEHILGRSYFGTPIKIEEIQVFDGMPTGKQVKEIITNLQIAVNSYSDIPSFIDVLNAQSGSVITPDTIIQGSIAMSLPNGIIYLPSGAESQPNRQNTLFIHEVFHQFQYQQASNKGLVFQELLQEMWDHKIGRRYDPYNYKGDKNPRVQFIYQIADLEKIKTLEGRAQFIQDFTKAYYNLDQIFYPRNDFLPAMNTNRNNSGINTRIQFPGWL